MALSGKNLNISQQAISIAIKQLENELKTALVVRNNKGSYLTPMGEYIAEFAQKIFTEWFDIVLKCQELQPISPIIKDIPFYMMDNYFLDPSISNLTHQFKLSFPETRLILKHATPKQIYEYIENDSNSLGLLMEKKPNQALPNGIKKIVLKEHILTAQVGNCSPLLKKGHVSLKKIRGKEIFLVQRQGEASILIEEIISKYKLNKYNHISYDIPMYLIQQCLSDENSILLAFYYKDHRYDVGLNEIIIDEIIKTYTICITRNEDYYNVLKKLIVT